VSGGSKFIKNQANNKTALQRATEESMKLKYADQMGQKVLVERTKLDGERTEALREVLRDIGRDMQTQKIANEGTEYKGSFSVHVYFSELLKRMDFVVLTAPDAVPFNVAEDACRELFGSICEDFGHKRPVRRSGTS
jgi:hypothetical protein